MPSNYDNWMRGLCEEDDDLAGPQEQAALLSYLNGTTTADEAAHGYLKQVTEPENHSAALTRRRLIDAAEDFPQAHYFLTLLRNRQRQKREWHETLGKVFPIVFGLHEAFNGNSNVFVLSIVESWRYVLQVSRVPHKAVIRRPPLSTITSTYALSSRASGISSTENGLIGPCSRFL